MEACRGTWYGRYALVLMASVYALNLVDRMLIILLLEPIKRDLRLTDSELGFITGIAYGLFYATMGIPLARWADRGNRVTLTALAMGAWSVAMAACLFVKGFAQLALARIAAAVGESGCKPPTYSLLGDYFPEPGALTRAMSVYWLGSPISSLLGFTLGGWLSARFGWRMTFLIMGIPGLALAVLFKVTMVEPRSRCRIAAQSESLPPFAGVLAALWHGKSLRRMIMGLILLYLVSSGMAPWYAAFLMRTHAMTIQEVGDWMGGIVGLGGAAGILLGGHLSSRLFKQNERGQMRVTAMSLVLVMASFVGFLTLRGRYAALAALIPLIVTFNFFESPVFALLQRLVTDDMRATSMTVIMLFAYLIGMGIGPEIVGVGSDLLRPMAGNDSLRYAMLLMSFGALGSAYCFWSAGDTVQQDLWHMEAQRAAGNALRVA